MTSDASIVFMHYYLLYGSSLYCTAERRTNWWKKLCCRTSATTYSQGRL